MKRLFEWFAILTSFGMLLVVLMGSIVTNTGSGHGCGNSWPLCYGKLLPTEFKLQTIIEYSHRIVSGWLGIMVVILAIWAWRRMRHLKEAKVLAILSVFFIILQALLGAAAVVWGQASTALALHFGFSLISFASVLLLAVLSFEKDGIRYAISSGKGVKRNIYLLFAYLYIVVYTGALVRHTGSAMGCSNQFPLCNGTLIPSFGGLAGIQYLHRFAALTLFVWIIASTIYMYKKHPDDKVGKRGFLLASIFVCLQGLSGALTVLSSLNLFITLSHGLIITCLFGIISFLVMAAWRKKT